MLQIVLQKVESAKLCAACVHEDEARKFPEKRTKTCNCLPNNGREVATRKVAQ